MNNTLIYFIKTIYEQAKLSKDSFVIRLYIANCIGACVYDDMQTGERDATDLWNSEWKGKFYKLLEK